MHDITGDVISGLQDRTQTLVFGRGAKSASSPWPRFPLWITRGRRPTPAGVFENLIEEQYAVRVPAATARPVRRCPRPGVSSAPGRGPVMMSQATQLRETNMRPRVPSDPRASLSNVRSEHCRGLPLPRDPLARVGGLPTAVSPLAEGTVPSSTIGFVKANAPGYRWGGESSLA
ncbi:hypothetical protein AAFF_G00206610 [Aldrovandia affinis]|uniref:Uncharacterized protein n=1 Tax=Aldrovandia affinis TaxID=143900 RepID=A0AAD7RHI0_9TELE|nr:hypothetical protein AAFF_G00206610 [Aldrovandia affinis]